MRRFFLHFFTPRHSNNHRAKLLHHKVLLTITLAFFVGSFFVNYISRTYPSVLGVVAEVDTQELLILTNQKRAEAGLTPLVIDERLSRAAEGKANDMFTNDYWAHISPDGKTPWIFIRTAGYSYVFAGENLARGFSNTSDVVNAWMNSQSHRDNMLSSKYNNVGFAVGQGKLNGEDTILVVEMFGSTGQSQAIAAVSKDQVIEDQNPQVVEQETPVVAQEAQVVTEEKSISPTPSLAQARKPQEKSIKGNSIIVASAKTPVINVNSFTRNISLFALVLFIFVFVLDIILARKKKLVRVAGHNIDHIFFFTMIIILAVILTRGAII